MPLGNGIRTYFWMDHLYTTVNSVSNAKHTKSRSLPTQEHVIPVGGNCFIGCCLPTVVSARIGGPNPSTIEQPTNLITLLRNQQVCGCVLNRGYAFTKKTFLSCPDFVFFLRLRILLFSSINSTHLPNLLLAPFQLSGVYYIVCEYMCNTFESDCEQTTTCKRNTFHSGTKDRQGTVVCLPSCRHYITVSTCMGL